MSDDYLKVIPADAHHIPPAKTHAQAIKFLERLFPDGEECKVETYGTVQFIDQGENLEAVICPACHARLELNHMDEEDAVSLWWYELCDLMEADPIESVQPTMPCCGASVNLLDLQFDWPAGFAQFELTAMNPNVGENMSDSQLVELETILGCKLRQVRAHY